MSDVFERIDEYGLIPVITVADTGDTAALGKALLSGGIGVAAVSFGSANATELLKTLSQEVPELVVGATDVQDLEQLKSVAANGGKFVLSTCTDEAKVTWGNENNLPVIVNVTNAADIEKAQQQGCKMVCICPCEANGGANGVKALVAQFNEMKFIVKTDEPCGFTSYLDELNVAAVAGKFAAPADLINAKDWTALTKSSRQYMDQVFDFTVGHVGINAETTENASNVTQGIQDLFDTDRRETGLAFFSGNLVEVMKVPFVGTHGHICVDTRNLTRALAMLKRKGVEFDTDKFFYDAKGNLMTAYLKIEIGGFAFHVRQHPKAK